MHVEFYRHALGEEEKQAVCAALDSIFVTTGPVTAEFERVFASYLKLSYAVGLMSCTHALELALHGLGISPGDEVITTPLTFIATAAAIERVGAVPRFVDVESDTGLIDVKEVARAIGSRTKCIMPVHLYGSMVDMRALRTLADEAGLCIVEDAAHCVEGVRDDVRPGQLGDAACFSFYATKNLTSGEGGALATNSGQLAQWVAKARLHGMTKDAAQRYQGRYQHWDMEFLGYKANMDDLRASLLLPQIKHIEARWKRREDICRRYEEAFFSCESVAFPRVPEGCRSARHLFTIWVDPARRDQVLLRLQEEGIGVAVNYRAIHLLSHYRQRFGFTPGSYPNAERIGASTISLPLYPSLTDDEVSSVIRAVCRVAVD